MTDTRKKASMSQVLADIKPYITKKFMAAPCINNVLKCFEIRDEVERKVP